MTQQNAERKASPRDMAGISMERLGEKYKDIVVLTADVNSNTKVDGFLEKYPERSYNMGIAEQNLLSFAAGLAQEGAVPFAFTFAPFATMRACEQLRTDVCYPNLPVKVLGSYAGYSGGLSGCTHCALEDCAITTSFGNMTVLEPSDPFLAGNLLEASVLRQGPMYMRLGLETLPPLYDSEQSVEIGKALFPVEGGDGAFLCSGITVYYAVEAAKRLKEECGAAIRVVDLHTIKPIDRDAVCSAAKTGRVICAQDHTVIGGLGYAAAAVIAEAGLACKFKILGCPDHFVPIAKPDYLYHLNHYDAAGLYEEMKALL